MTTGAVEEVAPVAARPEQSPPSPGLVARWLPLLLVCMVACGTVYAAAAPRSASFLTREASLEVLLQDVDRGLVHQVYEDNDHVVWRQDGDWRWTAAKMDDISAAGRRLNHLPDVLAEAALVNRDTELRVAHESEALAPLSTLGVLGTFGAFLLLVGGPAPQRANRWAWFWLFYVGRAGGLGVLTFLLLGARPARRRTEHRRQHGHAEPRERIEGWQGFAIAFVAGLAVAIVGSLLHDYAVPDRSDLATYTYDQSASLR